MLPRCYFPRKSHHIPGKTAFLAQLLHCAMESVACPMGPCAGADSHQSIAEMAAGITVQSYPATDRCWRSLAAGRPLVRPFGPSCLAWRTRSLLTSPVETE